MENNKYSGNFFFFLFSFSSLICKFVDYDEKTFIDSGGGIAVGGNGA